MIGLKYLGDLCGVYAWVKYLVSVIHIFKVVSKFINIFMTVVCH